MAKGKKNGKYLNVCIDADIYDRLASYCNMAGQSKTVAVERILGEFLDRFEQLSEKSEKETFLYKG